MQEQLVSFETAKLARDRGFTEYVENEYDSNGRLRFDHSTNAYYVVKRANDSISIASAPTQSLLQRWLREVHKIHVESRVSNVSGYFFRIKEYPANKIHLDSRYKTYELALEAGLLAALKLIK